MKPIPRTFYEYDQALDPDLLKLDEAVANMRQVGKLSPDVLRHISKFFRIKNIHHSNAIEGNNLSIGETKLVVEQGLTITGKPLKDSLEAKNLSHALDLFEQLANRASEPITEVDIKNVHHAILEGIDDKNAGRYRISEVEISGSQFKPPVHIDVPPKMEEFSAWLADKSIPDNNVERLSPLVIAAAAHAWFVYIHPFIDGNGRTARLIMNLLLMRYGYPIAIVTRDDRQRYYEALEDSQSSDLTSFISLLAECDNESLEEYQRAAQEQLNQQEWLQSIVSSIGESEYKKLGFEYEVWKNAMDLLKSYFSQTVNMVNELDVHRIVKVYFKDFGFLEIEKYLSLRRGASAKKTWFFRIDFRSGSRASRFLFFFGTSSIAMTRKLAKTQVSLHVAYEDAPYHFQKIDEATRADIPDLVEIAYDQDAEVFQCRYRGGNLAPHKVEEFGRSFIDQIAKRQF